MSKLKIPNQKAKYKALNARLNRYVLLVQNLYNTYNLEAAKLAHSTGYEGDVEFSFSHYPVTKQRLNDLIASWRKDLSAIITTGTSKEWGNSNLTQDLLADKVLSYYYGKEHGRRIRKYYQTNPDSLKAFQQRKDKGMNLSQKIWKQGEDYKSGLEAALSVGIQKGMSAVTLSKRVSKYLQDFDLLRKDYKQKYGKETDCLNCEYRSIRLARSEINMAYRTAEQKRWEQFDFVVGYEIKLSHVHHVKMPHGDICDTLAGKYPKDFKWTGWHPNDMCYAIPILKTEDEFFELDETSESENAVSDVPDSLKEWVIENEERIEQARIRGTLPYWLRDNDYKKIYKEYSEQEKIYLKHKKDWKHDKNYIYTETKDHLILPGKTVKCNIYTTIGGTKIVVPVANSIVKQKIEISKLVDSLEELPLGLKSLTKEIQLLDFYNPDDSYWRKVYKNFTHSFATGGDGVVRFYRNDNLRVDEVTIFEALAHENGHNLDYIERAQNIIKSKSKQWAEVVKNDETISMKSAVTTYGLNSESEDFAESCKLFCVQRKFLSEVFPNRYAYLRRLIKN